MVSARPSHLAQKEDLLPSLTLTLETVTPLFLAGADPRGAPELRPPSFRGAMRYWLRAGLGGLGYGLPAVRQREGLVFGSAGEDGARASTIAVRLYPLGDVLAEPFQRDSRGRDDISGRDYLYWTAARTRDLPERRYIRPGQRFRLTLEDRSLGEAKEAFLPAVASLWLLLQLGGVGSRSRRCGGSLAVVEPPELKGPSWMLRGKEAKSVAAELGAALTAVRRSIGTVAGPAPSLPTDYDVLSPATCSIRVLGVWPDAKAALDKVGSTLRRFRAGQPLPARAAFGLPIQNLRLDEDVRRRASPLWLKLARAGGGYACVATLFRSRLLPAEARPSGSLPRSPDLVERFLSEEWPGAAEVHYE